MHDPAAIIDRLDPTPHALEALLAELSDADARWKPPSGAWSIVEVVNHMADEDAEDFRARLERTLRDPMEAWPGFSNSPGATGRPTPRRTRGSGGRERPAVAPPLRGG